MHAKGDDPAADCLPSYEILSHGIKPLVALTQADNVSHREPFPLLLKGAGAVIAKRELKKCWDDDQAYVPTPGGVSFAAYEKAYTPAPGEAAHP